MNEKNLNVAERNYLENVDANLTWISTERNNEKFNRKSKHRAKIHVQNNEKQNKTEITHVQIQ